MKRITTINHSNNCQRAENKGATLGVFFSLLVGILLSSVIGNTAFAGFVHGYVYTREVVTNEAGNRIWGNYDPQTGAYMGDIGEAAGDRDPSEWRVMSGVEYQGYVDYDDCRARFKSFHSLRIYSAAIAASN